MGAGPQLLHTAVVVVSLGAQVHQPAITTSLHVQVEVVADVEDAHIHNGDGTEAVIQKLLACLDLCHRHQAEPLP